MDDMFQYINSVLGACQCTTMPDVSAESTSAEDPSTPVELCLQVGFAILFISFSLKWVIHCYLILMSYERVDGISSSRRVNC